MARAVDPLDRLATLREKQRKDDISIGAGGTAGNPDGSGSSSWAIAGPRTTTLTGAFLNDGLNAYMQLDGSNYYYVNSGGFTFLDPGGLGAGYAIKPPPGLYNFGLKAIVEVPDDSSDPAERFSAMVIALDTDGNEYDQAECSFGAIRKNYLGGGVTRYEVNGSGFFPIGIDEGDAFVGASYDSLAVKMQRYVTAATDFRWRLTPYLWLTSL